MALLLPVVTANSELAERAFHTIKSTPLLCMPQTYPSAIASLLVSSTQRPHLLYLCAFMYTYDTTTFTPGMS